MITSMSNSRRRRIAIAMATGMASSTRNGVMAYGTFLQRPVGLAEHNGQAADGLGEQHPGDGQPQPLHLLAQPLVAAPVPERQRHSAPPSSIGNTTASPFRVPSQVTGRRDLIASGFG